MSTTVLSLTQSLLGASIPVLCYHQVRPDSGMTPEKFGSHLDLIRRMGFETISLARLHDVITGKGKLTFPAIVITFDDCTLDNWVYAVPQLLRRNMTGVFFAITDFLRPGQARPRADQGGNIPIPRFDDIMNQALQGTCAWFMNHGELRALVHDLGMEVYSHSAAHQACFTSTKPNGTLADAKHWSHKALCGPEATADTPVYPTGSAYAHAGFGLDWSGRPLCIGEQNKRLALCLEDFSRAKRELETILSIPCPFLCLPWGQFDAATLQASAKAGYDCALTLQRDVVGPGSSAQRIGRIAVKDAKSSAWLRNKLLLHAHALPAKIFRSR
ncbi:MAG: polysaccharide deacetylase family protein [Desulfomicrobium sp.]|nr:polysaccharide deacetylase family protein [Desulfomicrobium sp.]